MFKRLFCSLEIGVLQVDFLTCVATLNLIVIIPDIPEDLVVAETVAFAVDEMNVSHTTIIPKIV